MVTPAKHRLVYRNPMDLKLGMELAHVGYTWRPYDERLPDHRADYDRLRADLEKQGKLTNPLIIYKDHVLIGMRRCEIARDLSWETVPCYEITEPIEDDLNADKVLAIRDQVYEPAPY